MVKVTDFSPLHEIEAQEFPLAPGLREIVYYTHFPDAGCNRSTGIALFLHNWGGTYKMMIPWCERLCNAYNLIGVSVNYLQSGETPLYELLPYDHGYLQTMDCLRALYDLRKRLDARNIPYTKKRTYAAGGSGGGNLSLMLGKFAPSTFAAIVDICGMPGLTDKTAYGEGNLNAGYLRDSADELRGLAPHKQEIRDPGNPVHLARQFRANPHQQTVIIHGLDDDCCDPAEKLRIAAAMLRAGFRPALHFVHSTGADGQIITDSGHVLGDRPAIVQKFADLFLNPASPCMCKLVRQDDLSARRVIEYPVTGGKYVFDYRGNPATTFVKDPDLR